MLTAMRRGPLIGAAQIPGDKSCSHRALILGAMARGTTIIEGLADGDDVMATVAALRAFERPVVDLGNGCWRVEGGPWHSPTTPVDCGNSGTTARLLIGAVAGMEGVEAVFAGDESLSARPMRRLIDPLRQMGAVIEGGNTLPLTVLGRRLSGIDHLNQPPSAQVKSALLLAAASADGPVRIHEPISTRDHTEIMLGVIGEGEQRTICIAADPSSAAFPLVAASIVPCSDVRVEGMLANPLRLGLYRVLERMGASLNWSDQRKRSGESVADLRVRHAPLKACRVMADEIAGLIDEVPALAVACAFAEGDSVIEGLGELRFKESNRLNAIASGLAACGVECRVEGDDLHIRGSGTVPGGVPVETAGDHRIAMAFLILGLASERPIRVDRPEMIATSFPGFVDTMRAIGARIE